MWGICFIQFAVKPFVYSYFAGYILFCSLKNCLAIFSTGAEGLYDVTVNQKYIDTSQCNASKHVCKFYYEWFGVCLSGLTCLIFNCPTFQALYSVSFRKFPRFSESLFQSVSVHRSYSFIPVPATPLKTSCHSAPLSTGKERDAHCGNVASSSVAVKDGYD